MFARFDENPAMTLRVIKETKRYGRTDGRTHGRTHGQRENSIPPTNKVCGGYNKGFFKTNNRLIQVKSISECSHLFVCLDSLRPINNLSVIKERGLPGLNQY